MIEKESPPGDTTESQSNRPISTSPFEPLIAQAVSRIKNEPFLFVIAITALVAALATLTSRIGSSNLRFIVAIIAFLACLAVVLYYVRDPMLKRSTRQAGRKSSLHPSTPPVFAESQQFEELSSFSQKKEQLIHPFEARISSESLKLTDEQIHSCAASPWDLDRILLYLYQEKSDRVGIDIRVRHAIQEWEKLRAREGRRSLMPLHYAIRSILRFLEKRAEPPQEAKASLPLFREIFDYLKARSEIDQGGEVKANLTRIIGLL